MDERQPVIDKEASEAVKRIERQMVLDGKLNTAITFEGAVIVFGPFVLLLIGGISVILGDLGLSNEARGVVGGLIVTGLVFWGCYLAARNSTGPQQ